MKLFGVLAAVVTLSSFAHADCETARKRLNGTHRVSIADGDCTEEYIFKIDGECKTVQAAVNLLRSSKCQMEQQGGYDPTLRSFKLDGSPDADGVRARIVGDALEFVSPRGKEVYSRKNSWWSDLEIRYE